jgi:mono/diheme cytochrome c family protein
MRVKVGLAVGLFVGLVAFAVWGGPSAGSALSSQLNRQWPAPVATDLPPGQPPLTPEEALKTFTMPPGFQLELVASEPLVQDPILSEFDGDGRLWVLELHGFAVDRGMDNSFEPINDLVVLEDTDDDGVYDKRTVFLDKLVMPRAFKVLANTCALVGEPPHLWKACDTNGDLRADTKDLISDDFAQQGVVEHGANGLYWSMDNTIVISQNGWNLSLKGGKPKILPSLSRGQWGVTQDDAGRVYRNINTDPLFVDYLKPDYYARNPNMVRTRGLYDLLVDQEKTLIWPARPTFGVNRGYRAEAYREDGSSTYYGGVSSPMIYRGESLPSELHGQPFVVDGPTNIVHLLRMTQKDGNLSAEDFFKRGEFLASTDERFRPISLTPGWDGTFYVVDMYRGVSQDGPLQTDYLRNYILERGLWEGIHYGRIYRVVRAGMKTDAKPHMSAQKPAELVQYLSHPNGWWRDTAQQLIVQRGDRSVVPALAELVRSAPDPRTRLQALWTIDGLGATQADLVDRALKDPDPIMRASAVRLTEDRLRAGDGAAANTIVAMAADPDLGVRRQVTASLGELPAEQRIAPLLAILRDHGDDPVTVDAAISGLAGLEPEMLRRLLDAPGRAKPADAAEMLAGAIGRSHDLAAIERVLSRASDSTPAETRLALLKGLATGLQGARGPMNFVAGGRAGGAIPGLGAPGRGGAAEQLKLAARPQPIIELAKGSDDSAKAAGALLSLLDWPGKPALPAAAPRSPEEERMFAAGHEIFLNVCSGCHLETGRGSAAAANLAGSHFVNGRPEVLARILLSGKEGKIGLMPPAGATMSDEELASVLTYIRGSFGNTASPVQPAAIKEWRAAYAYRKTPWTEQELEQ